MGSPRLIVASQSPRRKELLSQAGVVFDVVVSDAPEEVVPGETPEEMVARLSRLKAESVWKRHRDCWVLGADRVVALGNTVFGKPKSLEQAAATLRLLSGKSHRVLTGVTLFKHDGTDETRVVRTEVVFRDLSDEDIRHYLELVPVLDKAGAYAIQEHGELIVDHIDGSWSNVVGLPMETVAELLGTIDD